MSAIRLAPQGVGQYIAQGRRYSARVTPADLTIVVPTYNERDRLAELTALLFEVSSRAGIVLEIVVVDDNSPDGTGALADDLARTSRVKVVHRPGKLGLGSAVVEGFAVAASEIVGVMDADFSHPPASLPMMFAAMQRTGADMLIASRYIPGGSTPGWPLKRRVLSRLACLLAQPLSPIRDATSGFFLIRTARTRGLSLHASGFKIALELLVRARPVTVVEAPYRFDNRELGESKMNMREAAGYLVQLKNLGLWNLRKPRSEPWRYRRLTPAELADVTRRDRSPAPAARRPGPYRPGRSARGPSSAARTRQVRG
jgi:dolichol-phosphate mannosyltransferase